GLEHQGDAVIASGGERPEFGLGHGFLADVRSNCDRAPGAGSLGYGGRCAAPSPSHPCSRRNRTVANHASVLRINPAACSSEATIASTSSVRTSAPSL